MGNISSQGLSQGGDITFRTDTGELIRATASSIPSRNKERREMLLYRRLGIS
uniref:Uncharacterized protein n=1 Tax=Desertifilum tharense IPPAS B-1220 TaxID=1781255 RepID=A0ACD5GQI5_9CYAN